MRQVPCQSSHIGCTSHVNHCNLHSLRRSRFEQQRHFSFPICLDENIIISLSQHLPIMCTLMNGLPILLPSDAPIAHTQSALTRAAPRRCARATLVCGQMRPLKKTSKTRPLIFLEYQKLDVQARESAHKFAVFHGHMRASRSLQPSCFSSPDC